MSFESDVQQFAEQYQRDVRRVLVASVIEAHTSVRVGSPLTNSPGAPKQTGYLQNSIQLGWGAPPEFAQDGKGPNKEKDNIPAEPSQAVDAGFVVGKVAYVSTNTVYAEVQENLHKTKAHHWALTIAGWSNIVNHFKNQVFST